MSKDDKPKVPAQLIAQEQKEPFEELAASLRKMTEGRFLTPSEVLVRESRDER